MSNLVTIERPDSVLLIGVNRFDKRNAWNTEWVLPSYTVTRTSSTG